MGSYKLGQSSRMVEITELKADTKNRFKIKNNNIRKNEKTKKLTKSK